MDLDTSTLRVAFAIVALSMLVLFYAVTFRSTRSAYSGWWCIALTLFLAGSAAFLLNGTELQQWANPVGNALLVLGTASAWAAARSLEASATRWWLLAVPALLTWIVSMFDHPATNVWAGGPVFLAVMAVLFGLSARVMWRLSHEAATRVQASMGVGAGLLCAFYVARCIALLAAGQDGTAFVRYFGSDVTTLVTLVFLVAVSFSMSVLGNEQATQDLRRRATVDGLTGLLNRAEFFRRAAHELHLLKRAGRSGALVLADLDHFKEINDRYGHQAGDRALAAFAAACRATVRSTDLVGRYGGEEFVILLPGTTLERAEQITSEISRQLQATPSEGGFSMPTVSYGLALTNPREDLSTMVEAADSALYRAKELGRNRAVRERR